MSAAKFAQHSSLSGHATPALPFGVVARNACQTRLSAVLVVCRPPRALERQAPCVVKPSSVAYRVFHRARSLDFDPLANCSCLSTEFKGSYHRVLTCSGMGLLSG